MIKKEINITLVYCRAAVPISSRKFVEMQIFRVYPRSIESNIVRVVPAFFVLTSSPGIELLDLVIKVCFSG